jgi:hypothetical protein
MKRPPANARTRTARSKCSPGPSIFCMWDLCACARENGAGDRCGCRLPTSLAWYEWRHSLLALPSPPTRRAHPCHLSTSPLSPRAPPLAFLPQLLPSPPLSRLLSAPACSLPARPCMRGESASRSPDRGGEGWVGCRRGARGGGMLHKFDSMHRRLSVYASCARLSAPCVDALADTLVQATSVWTASMRSCTHRSRRAVLGA